LLVKAHQLNLEVFELPEKYQNKFEEDPDRKKIAKLEKELVESKVKLPNLRLVSKDNEEKIIAQTLPVENSFNADVEHETNKIKEEHPQITETFKPKRTVTRTINGKPYHK